MPIKLPKERTYYGASPAEPDWLLVWIPPDEYDKVASNGAVAGKLARDYPRGFEVEVSDSALKEAGVDLGLEVRYLKAAYHLVRATGGGPKLWEVAGRAVERRARGLARGEDRPPPGGEREERLEPEMTDGDEPLDVFIRLSGGGRRRAR